MAAVKLPISKSVANRLLLLQAIHGDRLMRVSSDMPDDVIVLHDALQKIREVYGVPGNRISPSFRKGAGEGLTLHLKNCGTALRFLQVHLQLCYPSEPITLTGDPRLMERDGAPTSQTTSALILHGVDVPVTPDESPYITMSRRMAKSYIVNRQIVNEADWSAAGYWYEYIAIHGGELLLEGLKDDSLQGDRIVADLYADHFGVTTTFTPEGALIVNRQSSNRQSIVQSSIVQSSIFNLQSSISLDFERIPDLYPAVALTCERLGIQLHATGTERLRYKESDRLEAVRLHEVRNDHRMAMALMASGAYPLPLPEGKGEEMQRIIAKSYPMFVEQMNALLIGRDGVGLSHITPIRGVNDDGLGKKHALSKLIHAATSEYVWLHDDDVVLPDATQKAIVLEGDLIILPLKMESLSPKPSLLERLQIAEYAAIQEITMRAAKRGHAVMCSGANLIVRREAWIACEPDLHPEIPSGDDMFLLEAMKRREFTIGVIDEPDYTAVVRPLTSWRAFFRQRMRWAGKAPHYTDPDIRRCGALVLAANLLQILCPLIILVKFPIEYNLVRQREWTNHQSPITNHQSPITNKKPRTPWYVVLLLEVIYPFYLLLCLVGGLFRTSW